MSITIQEVTHKKQLEAFIRFPYRLYKNNPYYVPSLLFDERATLRKDKNPAFDDCEARYWLAYRNKKVVGRIAAIISHAFIEKWKHRYMRFGWIDFEDDPAIPQKLLHTVEAWAKEKGMTAVHGPMGFTDLDHEGMLVEGFDQLGTLAAIYNHPYYPEMLEELGYRKDADWVEYKITLPDSMPEKLEKMASIVRRRNKLEMVKASKAKEILPYAKDIFELINESYADLYGVVPLTEKQIAYYTQQYFSFIRPDFVPLVIDQQGKLVAFGITMPSLSHALQKAKGSLFPFGFMHLLKALKKNKQADLYLVAVKKELQGKGVNALLMHALTESYIKNGIRYAESNPELEMNTKVQSIWEHYEAIQHKRRRCYIKHL
ncbi:MAG: GNAT family N-acetyltransferase [Bacteroidota bacterium]|nr:GNAT family N-acetyltransferase [Bacteroidota bacterium]